MTIKARHHPVAGFSFGEIMESVLTLALMLLAVHWLLDYPL
jgi:F0F1-type ATP synthase assembly protein I